MGTKVLAFALSSLFFDGPYPSFGRIFMPFLGRNLLANVEAPNYKEGVLVALVSWLGGRLCRSGGIA
jgi:hypothetical protein